MTIIRSLSSAIIIAIVAVGLSASSSKAASLIINASFGNLTGATGVDLGVFGIYSVSFGDGTCAELFTGCDDAGDFALTSAAQATAAGQALLDQVFLDTFTIFGGFPTNPYDTVPGSQSSTAGPLGGTLGCTGFTNDCNVFIPYASFPAGVGDVLVTNAAAEIGDVVTDFGVSPNFDLVGTSGAFNLTFAVFTQTSAPSVIPLPPAALLFGTALLGLAGFARRKRRA